MSGGCKQLSNSTKRLGVHSAKFATRLTADLWKEEEEDYKLWPANKSDRSWQSLSNPAKRHSFVSN